jgi:hypothetical protein
MIASYVIDAALSEEHTNEAEVSDFPVEDGSNFTDNVRVKPRRYRMNGVVTDTPLDLGFRSLQDDGSSIVDASTRQSAQAKKALEAIFQAAKPVTIVTSLDTYKNMVMQTLTFQQDGDTGDALPFTAAFVQINVISNVRRTIKIKFTAVDRGNLAAHPPGWIGTDKLGRDIVVDPSTKGPGLQPKYLRADGTAVPPEEAAAATRRQGAVLVKYDKDGHAIPIDQQDYQPFTPRQKTPFWSPQSPLPPGVPIQ